MTGGIGNAVFVLMLGQMALLVLIANTLGNIRICLERIASAIEARRAATENTDAVHESAGPKDDAQPGEPQ